MRTSRSRLTAALGSLAAAGVLFAVLGEGPRVFPDSAPYVSAARHLEAGNGLVTSVPDSYRFLHDPGPTPLRHLPPLYPALLAVVSPVAGGVFGAARLVAALLFGATVWLTWGIVAWAVPTSRWPAAVTGGAVAVSPVLIDAFSMVQSETLFLPLVVGALAAGVRRARGGVVGWWIASAALTALACLTRYPGVALVPILAAGELARPGPLRRRAASALAWTAAAVAPLALWMAGSGTAAGRSPGVHPPTGADLDALVQTLSLWVAPARVPAPAGFLVALAALALLAWLGRGLPGRPPHREGRDGREDGSDREDGRGRDRALLALAAGFAVAYVALVVAARTFVDGAVRFDPRTLLPAYPAVVLCAGVVLAHGTARPAPGRRVPLGGRARPVVLAALGTFVLLYGVRSYRWLRDLAHLPAPSTWVDADLSAAVAAIPADRAVYTNIPYLVYFLQDRPAYYVPTPWDEYRKEPNALYGRETERLRALVAEGTAAVVWYGPAPVTERERALGLCAGWEGSGGRVYDAVRAPAGTPCP